MLATSNTRTGRELKAEGIEKERTICSKINRCNISMNKDIMNANGQDVNFVVARLALTFHMSCNAHMAPIQQNNTITSADVLVLFLTNPCIT